MVLKCWMFSFEGWIFSCSLNVLIGGLEINIMPICYFFFCEILLFPSGSDPGSCCSEIIFFFNLRLRSSFLGTFGMGLLVPQNRRHLEFGAVIIEIWPDFIYEPKGQYLPAVGGGLPSFCSFLKPQNLVIRRP